MLIFVLGACTFAPVPPHGDALEPILEAGLELDWAGAAEAARPLGAPVEGLNATDRSRWNAVRDAAEQVVLAKKKSEFSAAYASLVSACVDCHGGQVLHGSLSAGHAGAFEAMELAVATGSRDLADEAVLRVRASPDLGPSHARLLDLATKIRDANSDAMAAKLYGKAVLECYQCHGSLVRGR
ncbi:MAG: hypothetical protein R3F61_00845 [Myxococcota bacterium]